MNKKGFTLVELLAVIAILAILVIVALPNVLSMYRDARKNTFSNEISSVLRSARQQYLVDGGVAREYTNADGYTNNLKLPDRSKSASRATRGRQVGQSRPVRPARWACSSPVKQTA